jgi:hypothetical protein
MSVDVSVDPDISRGKETIMKTKFNAATLVKPSRVAAASTSKGQPMHAARAAEQKAGNPVSTAMEAAARPTAPAVTQKPSEEEIRLKAYEKYCARHGAPGDEVSDWMEAEHELCG